METGLVTFCFNQRKKKNSLHKRFARENRFLNKPEIIGVR